MSTHPAIGPLIVAGIFAVATSIVFVPSTVPIICIGSGCAFTKAYGSAMWGLLIALLACYIGAFIGSFFAFILGRYIFKE
jgi:membrane protein DedA with SNARE-associated domain